MALPADVHRVRAKGRFYYYFQPGRNTKAAAARVALGSDTTAPEFWRKLRDAQGGAQRAPPPKSIAALVAAFKASREWEAYEDATRRDYAFYLDKIEGAWGPLSAAELRPIHVLAFRDTMAGSPGSANHMLSIGKTLFKWGAPREFALINPFREVARLRDDDDGHWPWPDWARDHVAAHAPADLARFVYLALATGQRESDVVRMGVDAIEDRGLWVRPKKTKRRRAAFWVPLLTSAAAEIARWRDEPLVFHLPRRRAPLAIPPGAAFVLSPAGHPYTPEGLRSRWNRWLETPEGATLLARWAEWRKARQLRDGDAADPDETFKPTLHGLRSTAVRAPPPSRLPTPSDRQRHRHEPPPW